MEISVVISTYNGEQYIREQLVSILSQTLLPDEVIISDDGSSDKTASIVKEFIDNNKLNNWKFYVNEVNLGWKKNFMNLLNQSKGNYVFLCDQDDVWNKNKLIEMTSVMKENNKILLLASDYIPFYETKDAKKISKKILKTMKYDNSVEKYPFSSDFLSVMRPGCTYCVRRSLIEVASKYFDDISAHDALLWRVSNLYDGLYIYHSAMIEFRRHSNNATPKKSDNIQSKKKEISSYQYIIGSVEHMLLNAEQSLNNKDNKQFIVSKNQSFYQLRYKLFNERKISVWVKLFFFYRKYYFSKRNLIYDLIILIKSI